MKTKKTGIVLVLFALAFAFGTSCEDKKKCDKNCRLEKWIEALIQASWGACGSEISMGAGEIYNTRVPEPPRIYRKKIDGCSSAPSRLTITPSAGITIQLFRAVAPFCLEGELLGQNSAPGDVLVFSNEDRCVADWRETVIVRAHGAAGTLSFELQ